MDDLHTGKFFNNQLWLVYDIGALSLVLFVVTGLYLWAAPYWVRRKKASSPPHKSVLPAPAE